MSVYGVRGLAGGIQQWCNASDIWGDTVDDGLARSPAPDDSPNRQTRGGSWNHFVKWCRSAWRQFLCSVVTVETLGIRAVRPL